MTPLRLRYQTLEFGKTDIHLCTLRNRQEFHDPDGAAAALGISDASWPIFGIVWPSSLVLAHYMNDYDTDDKKVLEVGCGMALSSIMLNKKDVDVTATDYHPEVEGFLNRNTQLNGDTDIAYERTGWADGNDSLGKFDIIIGSDLLYEDEHIKLLADFIESHAADKCDVILVDPGRGRKSKVSTVMAGYGFSFEHFKPTHTNYLDAAFKGHILKFERTASTLASA